MTLTTKNIYHFTFDLVYDFTLLKLKFKINFCLNDNYINKSKINKERHWYSL